MDLESLTTFFMGCTIINLAVYLLWVAFLIFAPDLVYQVQSKWFRISRETFDVVAYSFLGAFKIFFVVFSVAPYLALLLFVG